MYVLRRRGYPNDIFPGEESDESVRHSEDEVVWRAGLGQGLFFGGGAGSLYHARKARCCERERDCGVAESGRRWMPLTDSAPRDSASLMMGRRSRMCMVLHQQATLP